MKLNSQICTTVEQSERLLGLGLKKETADMCWIPEVDIDAKGELYDTGNYYKRPIMGVWDFTLLEGIPAWSLCRLIEMTQEVCSRITIVHSWVRIENRCMPFVDYPCDSFDNTYDNLIDCIEWLIKEGYFNKEYLV